MSGAIEERFGVDEHGRFDAYVLAYQIATYGKEAADKDAAAKMTEKMLPIILARLTNKFREGEPSWSRKECEDQALGSGAYEEQLAVTVEARRVADIAKARYVAVRALAEGLRTQESTRRAEMMMR